MKTIPVKPQPPDAQTIQQSIDIVAVNGRILRNLHAALRDTESVVSAAVGQNGNALQYASDELRDRKDLVLIAVKQNGMALKFAGPVAATDGDVIRAACAQDKNAAKLIGADAIAAVAKYDNAIRTEQLGYAAAVGSVSDILVDNVRDWILDSGA